MLSINMIDYIMGSKTNIYVKGSFLCCVFIFYTKILILSYENENNILIISILAENTTAESIL